MCGWVDWRDEVRVAGREDWWEEAMVGGRW
jgi:hypothetical protein